MAEEVADLFAKLGLQIDEASWLRGDKLIAEAKDRLERLGRAIGLDHLKEWVGQTVEAGDQAVKTAQKIGITAESVQELKYAAEQSGVSFEELVGGLGKLAHGLHNDLAAGTGPSIDALKELGLSVSAIKTKMSGPGGMDDILNVVAAAFQDMEEGPNKSALAMNLFGRAGEQLIPFLNAGPDGLADLRKEANDLGVVLDGKTGKALEAFGDDTDRLKKSWAGVRNEIVTAALPYLQAAATALLDLMKRVVAWFKDHRDEVGAFFHAVGAVVSFVIDAIGEAIDVAKLVFGFIVDAVRFVVDIFVELGKAIAEVFEFLADVATTVFEYIQKGIALLAAAWRWLSDRVVAFFTKARDVARSIVDVFVSIGRSIREAFEAAFDFVADLPVVKQLRDLLLDVAHIGNSKAQGAYETAFASGQTTLSRSEFEAQQARNIKEGIAAGTFAPETPPPTAPIVAPIVPVGSSTVVNAPITVNPSSGMDEAAVGREVKRRLDDEVRKVNP